MKKIEGEVEPHKDSCHDSGVAHREGDEGLDMARSQENTRVQGICREASIDVGSKIMFYGSW